MSEVALCFVVAGLNVLENNGARRDDALLNWAYTGRYDGNRGWRVKVIEPKITD